MTCDSMHSDVGKMVIKALAVGSMDSKSKSSFELGMHSTTHGSFDSGLFWTYKKDDVAEGDVSFCFHFVLLCYMRPVICSARPFHGCFSALCLTTARPGPSLSRARSSNFTLPLQ